jgi:hypothetical protein
MAENRFPIQIKKSFSKKRIQFIICLFSVGKRRFVGWNQIFDVDKVLGSAGLLHFHQRFARRNLLETGRFSMQQGTSSSLINVSALSKG